MASARKKALVAPPVPDVPVFTAASLKFLRSLARNNDREWFHARRVAFDRDCKAPLLALIEQINVVLDEVAPVHVKQPQKAMLRIFRDTRFSPDKRPLKRHVGAWWGLPGNERNTGPGFYLHVGAQETVIAAGIYSPKPEHLLALRRWFATSHEEVRALMAQACKGTPLTPEDPKPLTRVPRGFPADHPAADLLKCRLLAVSAELPPEAALEPGFAALVETAFRAAAPLVVAMDEVVRRAAKTSEL
jgi:uncharacterized protein (TIGR02453 family)